MSKRLDQQRQKEIEPKRMTYAKEQLEKIGIKPFFECESRIDFLWKGEVVMFYPFTGWATGKSIKDGRGIEKLLNQLK